MTIIHPLLASRSAPNYRQSWRLAGVWRRAINLMTESGELLTLHRQGSGFGPGGWMLRRAQFDALCGGLCGNERPQVVAQGIRLGRFTVKQPQRYCLLRITPPAHPQPLAAAWMQRAEETGLFGAILVILLFACLIWRLMVAAVRAGDLMGELIGAGIMGHIAIQVILNIAVVTNTIPNTGITLPFISYGGTSVLFLLGEMGLALSVTRYSRAA